MLGRHSKACLSALYPGQEPRHWGTIIKFMLGGPDPLDGISVYVAVDPVPHWHYVSYGFSELCGKESEDLATSGYGFELTFRLGRAAEAAEPPIWPVSLLQNLARYVFRSGNAFATGDHMNLNGPISLSDPSTPVAIAADPQLRPVSTPNGRLAFLQLVGLTADEFAAARRWNTVGLQELVANVHERWVFGLERRSILDDPSIRARFDEGVARDGSSTGLLFNDSTGWEPEHRWLGRAKVVVRLGANPGYEVADILPGRVPHGRGLVLHSGAHNVAFRAADAGRWEADGDELRIDLTPDQALAVAEGLRRGVGAFHVPGLAGVRFEVVPSLIKDLDGRVVREVR